MVYDYIARCTQIQNISCSSRPARLHQLQSVIRRRPLGAWLHSLGLLQDLCLANLYRTKVLKKLSLDEEFSINSGVYVYENVMESTVAQ